MLEMALILAASALLWTTGYLAGKYRERWQRRRYDQMSVAYWMGKAPPIDPSMPVAWRNYARNHDEDHATVERAADEKAGA